MTDGAADQLAIQRVKADYAYACDNADWALLASVFAEDATLDYTSVGGPVGGRDEVVGWLEQSLTPLTWIHHVVTGFQIDLDGNRATARSRFHCTSMAEGLTQPVISGGYYDETSARPAAGRSRSCTRTTAGCWGCRSRRAARAAS